MSNFNIELKFLDKLKITSPFRRYNVEDDDVRSILMDACKKLELSGYFSISGFGQEKWPVDIGTDLSVLLEQMPDAIRAINSNLAFEIDLYEQGVERLISFSPSKENYVAVCTSQTSWQPNPMIENIPIDHLKHLLVSVISEFSRALENVSPEIMKNSWLKDWLQSTKIN